LGPEDGSNKSHETFIPIALALGAKAYNQFFFKYQPRNARNGKYERPTSRISVIIDLYFTKGGQKISFAVHVIILGSYYHL
jgi:hypothetical protein